MVQQKKKKKSRLWKLVRKFLKWLLIFLVLYSLLSLLKDFLVDYDLAIKRVNQQNAQIERLNGELELSTQLNFEMNEQLQKSHSLLKQYQTQEQTVIQPIAPQTSSIESEAVVEEKPNLVPIIAPVVVVTAIQILKVIVFRGVPVPF